MTCLNVILNSWQVSTCLLTEITRPLPGVHACGFKMPTLKKREKRALLPHPHPLGHFIWPGHLIEQVWRGITWADPSAGQREEGFLHTLCCPSLLLGLLRSAAWQPLASDNLAFMFQDRFWSSRDKDPESVRAMHEPEYFASTLILNMKWFVWIGCRLQASWAN